MKLAHIDTWIFDLDHTLYPPSTGLFAQIEPRMTAYVMRVLKVDEDRANHLRRHYWRQHGTTLAGLMAEHGIAPGPYLAHVHDVDFSALRPNPELAAAIDALPGRKIIHTNADSTYAARVLKQLGLGPFDAVYGVEEVGFHPKPTLPAYQAVLRAEGFEPGRAAMFEDDPRNLSHPHDMGMCTILVGSGRHGPDILTHDHDHGPHVHHRTDDLAAFLRTVIETR